MLAQSIHTQPALTGTDRIIGAVALAVAIIGFSPALAELVGRWYGQEEYGHGFLIPILSAWLLWARRDALAQSIGRPSWLGLVIVLAAVLLHLIGGLSAMFLFSQLAFIGALIGVVLAFGGYSLLRVTVLPIAFLVFAIPLPYFLETILTWRLQIVSSELGAAFIRLFDIPVYLEGNVIDLGNYKIQVIEACSGLRYLYPLLSLGFLAAYFFHAPMWQRILVFLSTIPITILMNSVRIGAVGLLVNRWGTGMAEGMLHLFEGWVIFLACAGLLVAEIYLLARFVQGQSLFRAFGMPEVSARPALRSADAVRTTVPMFASLAVLLLGAAAAMTLTGRHEQVPERTRFAHFPSKLGPWNGQLTALEPETERALGVDDYIQSNYATASGALVNFYVAYYASQRNGVSPHSPIVCLPGGGWQIVAFERTSVASGLVDASPLNRAVIERGDVRQLVYYWFVQRGRVIANEYWSKWYLFVDAILQNRTDGALVRVTTPIAPHETERDADARLQAFLAEINPRLAQFLPATAAPLRSVSSLNADPRL